MKGNSMQYAQTAVSQYAQASIGREPEQRQTALADICAAALRGSAAARGINERLSAILVRLARAPDAKDSSGPAAIPSGMLAELRDTLENTTMQQETTFALLSKLEELV